MSMHATILELESLRRTYEVNMASSSSLDEAIERGWVKEEPHLREQIDRRGTVVASWLACLCSQPGYTAALQAAQAHTPAHNKWITELALADIQGALWPGHPRLQGAIRELRQRLNTVAHPHFVIRPALTPSELAQLQLEQQRILAAYRLGGRAAATQALTGTLASVVLCAKPAMKLAP